jgi:hypothetical protein
MSLVVQQFLTKKKIPVIAPQPLYSPDIATSDFWLLPTLK